MKLILGKKIIDMKMLKNLIQKNLSIFILMIIPLLQFAQSTEKATDNFTVIGLVKNDLKISVDDILQYKSIKIDDVQLINHAGENRKKLVKLEGVLIKDILKNMDLKEENPKLFSEFYFTFVANDGYKIVYSWNEIFNTSTGYHLYLITSKNGKDLKNMEDRILILTPSDFKTGRRHIKGLQKIIVNRAE